MLLTLELLTFWQLLAPFKLLLSHFLTVSVLLASVSGWIIFIHSVKQPCSLPVSQPGSAHSFTAGAAVWGLEGLALAWRDFHSSSRPAKSLSACKMQCEFCLLMKRGNGSDGPWNLGTMKTPVTLPQTKREPAFKIKGHISGEYGFALQIWQACPAMTFKFSVKTKESFWEKINAFDVWSSWKLSMNTKASCYNFFTYISYTQYYVSLWHFHIHLSIHLCIVYFDQLLYFIQWISCRIWSQADFCHI